MGNGACKYARQLRIITSQRPGGGSGTLAKQRNDRAAEGSAWLALPAHTNKEM